MTTMTRTTPHDVEARLRAIIARVAKTSPDAFGPDEDLAATLGLDSLSALRIAAAVEREFAVRIPDDELHEVRTLGALLARLEGWRLVARTATADRPHDCAGCQRPDQAMP